MALNTDILKSLIYTGGISNRAMVISSQTNKRVYTVSNQSTF
jgi:hypothetical protein